MSFGRLERREAARPMSDINMTPLIDVMLVLLVIFIIAAPLMASALKLELPKSEAATPGAGNQFVAISIDAQGRYFMADEPMDGPTVKARLQTLAAQRPDAELRLSADRNVPYGQVAQLIDWAQSANLNHIAFISEQTPTPPPP